MEILHVFTNIPDHGYGNFHVETTNPAIGDIISPDTSFITIKYYDKVDLSIGNIQIVQDDNTDHGIIRQIISGSNNDYVKLDENGTTVSFATIKSTFSQPSGKYFVLVDYNFVKNRINQEPLYGIKKKWFFTTCKCFINSSHFEMKLNCFYIFQIVPEEENEDSSGVAGRVRLNPEGTSYFKNLDVVGRKEFYMKLRQELAKTIPINLKRITTNGNIETDTSISSKQILLSIDIEEKETKQEISVTLAIQVLDTLIKKRSITAISSGEYTKYLDEDYGYKTFRKNFIH